MSGDTITYDQVLSLVRRLSPADQARLRAALPPVADSAAEQALQRQHNQAAINLLDEWLADTTDHDDLEGGESWEAMLRDMDAFRPSARKLFPQLSEKR